VLPPQTIDPLSISSIPEGHDNVPLLKSTHQEMFFSRLGSPPIIRVSIYPCRTVSCLVALNRLPYTQGTFEHSCLLPIKLLLLITRRRIIDKRLLRPTQMIYFFCYAAAKNSERRSLAVRLFVGIRPALSTSSKHIHLLPSTSADR